MCLLGIGVSQCSIVRDVFSAPFFNSAFFAKVAAAGCKNSGIFAVKTDFLHGFPKKLASSFVGNLLTKYVRKGPQVIVNVSNDGWFRNSVCGAQQARNAAFRCIELRRPMVRAANRGVCCSIAPNGAFIHALLKADGTPHLPGYSYAVLPVDRNAGFTLYALLGDWAVVVCALLALLTMSPRIMEKLAAKRK